ncbi:MAG: hypothetical protein AMXMBFR84_25300 [Candidatus Hydrogenedentota bacterium]
MTKFHTMQAILTLAAATTPIGWCEHLAGNSPFKEHVVDENFQNGYQVCVTDINADGLPDIAALSTTPSQLVWFKNPKWEKFTISTKAERNIDLAPYDIDRDGDMDLALATGFDLGNSNEGGQVFWAECPDAPETDQEWALHPIDTVPTSHRVRWADVNGDGRKELINLPIIGIGAAAPQYEGGVQFKAYTLPEDPIAGKWEPQIIDNTLEMAHGLFVVPSVNMGNNALITASFGGIHMYVRTTLKKEFIKSLIGEGDRNPRPKQGSSEAALGRLKKPDSFCVAAIEPWHGNQVVVYTPTRDGTAPWPRTVIDDTLSDGHALACADFNGDGNDEIIAGCRGEPKSIFIYDHNAESQVWARSVLNDAGIACAGLFIADMNDDSRADIVAIGTSTNNVVWYENLAP